MALMRTVRLGHRGHVRERVSRSASLDLGASRTSARCVHSVEASARACPSLVGRASHVRALNARFLELPERGAEEIDEPARRAESPLAASYRILFLLRSPLSLLLLSLATPLPPVIAISGQLLSAGLPSPAPRLATSHA